MVFVVTVPGLGDGASVVEGPVGKCFHEVGEACPGMGELVLNLHWNGGVDAT